MISLSVVIPVYNCIDYLENCIKALVKVNRFCKAKPVNEIILVDDGSTDGSSALCDQFKRQFSENCTIQVIHQENSGVSVARNVGLQVAKGEFVLFVDADDFIDSEKLAQLLQVIAHDKSVDMAVFGMSFDYYSRNKIYRQDVLLPPVEGIKVYNECTGMLVSLFNNNMITPLWNKLIRRSVIEDAGISLREDMFVYEDMEFSLRALAQCKRIHFCADPIYHYRQPQDENNAGRRLKRISHIPEIVDKIEEALLPFDKSDDIILPLYLTLAREKISCTSREETDIVCNDFREWVDTHGFLENIQDNEYGMMLYHQQTAKLLFRRNKSRIRHGIANAVKKTIGDFRKW